MKTFWENFCAFLGLSAIVLIALIVLTFYALSWSQRICISRGVDVENEQ